MTTRNNKSRGGLWLLAGLTAGAFVILSLGLLMFMPRGTGTVQAQDQPEPAVVADEYADVPWVGEMGITETVAEIMARPQEIPPFPTEAEAEEKELPDRSLLPQNPYSPEVSQWPPSEYGDVTPEILPAPQDAEGRAPGEPNLPQTPGTSFLGINSGESGYVPPDSMGAVGPTQILMCENGRIKVFDKAGTLGGLNATTNTFFTSVRNGSSTSDPRVMFDRLTSRWFVIMINVSSPNRVLIAVSSGPTITSSSSFTFYYFQQDTVTPTSSTDTGGLLDYPSLGVDANALYIAGNMFNSSYRGSTGFVVRKSSVLSGGPIVVTAFRQMCTSSGSGPQTPMGVDNDDPTATEGYFIGVDNASYGTLVVRRISSPGGTPTISGNLNITVPTTGAPMGGVVAQGSSNPLDDIDDRLMGAKLHMNHLTGAATLWTAHHIEVNSSGVFSSSGNRDGVRWYQIGNMTGTPTLLQSGTLYDSAASSPNSYWMGHAVMNGQGHMGLGCSVAGSTRHAEIAGAGRLSSDTAGTTQAPTTLQTTSSVYNVQTGTQRWGDYSCSNIDPNDDMTIWTFQEYCSASNQWGVRAVQLLAPPPATPSSCTPPTVNQGDLGVNVVVTGTSSSGSGFYDPDSSFPNHISASVSGTGVTVNTITFTDPTHITLNLTVAGSAPTGARTISVTNPDGQSATSASGILTVGSASAPPSITTQPQSQTVCVGGSVTFTVVATGTPPLTYQWRKNGSNIGGATSTSYTINPVALSDAANYDCVVTNAYGSVTSNAATLTVNSGPSITTQPQSQTVCSGGSVTFTVIASGTAPLSYQWRKGGSNIGGATNSSYTINPVTTGSAGSYDCVVTNSCGSVTSNPATLTVNTAPTITTQPQSQSVCVGGSVTFSVVASGAGSYQWRKNSANIGGATSSSYTINPVAAGDAGSYDCVVTNSCGSTTSNAATLTVNSPPSISTQPQDQTACVGGSATFSVVASGATSYQWRKNGTNIGGATSSSYTINPVASGDAGDYDCVVTNACGSVTSSPASLTVNTGPNITTQPQSQSVCSGGSVTFTVVASGTAPLSYQWRKNGSNIGGATSSSYTINPVGPSDAAGYDCRITNLCGSVTSNSATLTVNTAPSITTNPQSQTVCEGASATFSVVASGATSYQWRKNGSNIGGATGSSYTINPVGTGDAGDYDCVVSNACGSVTSNSASLTVNVGPGITTQPQSQTVCAGDSVTFTVAASGTAPLSYQWRKNGANIGGATGTSYTINPVAVGDGGTYDCRVTNACGSVTSNGATLTVNVGPSISTQPQSQSVCEGSSVTFSVAAIGTPAPSYQWRKDGLNIGGATSNSYTINPVATGDAADYDCVLTNVCGSVTSNIATLVVNTAPSISGQPQSQTVCAGDPVTFTVTASGATGYQWRKNGTNIGGATATSYTIDPVSTGDAATYDCVVTNACGSVTSDPATLTVDTAPTITTNPTSATTQVGGSATFTVAATGTGPLSYQWRFNGGNIGGATGTTLTIDPVALADAGTYDCVVTNACGSTTSGSATLTVWRPGDMNCDGVVNNQDIDPFVLALFNPLGYMAAFPNCDIRNGDFTGDGVVNNQDIDGFVHALFGS